MERLYVRRIWSLKDVVFVANGVAQGIRDEVYSDLTLMETLRLISSKDVTFYIFSIRNEGEFDRLGRIVPVGFGAIRNDREVYKLFVVSQARGHGFGTRISLWLKQAILKRGYIPICFIKEANEKWSKTMSKQGMTKVDAGFDGTNKYMLTDFESYLKAIAKYKISEVRYVKKMEKTPKITRPIQHIRRHVMG